MHIQELGPGGALASFTGRIQVIDPHSVALAGITLTLAQDASHLTLRSGDLVNLHASWSAETTQWHVQAAFVLPVAFATTGLPSVAEAAGVIESHIQGNVQVPAASAPPSQQVAINSQTQLTTPTLTPGPARTASAPSVPATSASMPVANQTHAPSQTAKPLAKSGFAFGSKPTAAQRPASRAPVAATPTANASQVSTVAGMPEKRNLNAALFKKPAASPVVRTTPYVPQRPTQPSAKPAPAAAAQAPASPATASVMAGTSTQIAKPALASRVVGTSTAAAPASKQQKGGFGVNANASTTDTSHLPGPSILQQQDSQNAPATAAPSARGTLAGPERDAWLKAWCLDDVDSSGDIPY